MYSMMALSPLASEIDRCRVARRSSPGVLSVTTVNGSFSSAVTASWTVAKLSSTYCAQAAMVRPGLEPLPKAGYSDSTSQSRLAMRPASFIPSVVATS